MTDAPRRIPMLAALPGRGASSTMFATPTITFEAPPQADLEAAMIDILRSAIPAAHRERELIALLVELDPRQASHIGCRLDIGRTGDPLVRAFLRLAPHRRARLRRLIADIRRRLAPAPLARAG